MEYPGDTLTRVLSCSPKSSTTKLGAINTNSIIRISSTREITASGCHHTGRSLQRFLCVNVHFLIWEKQAGEPAAQCPLLLPGACLLILFTHIQQPPSLLVYTNAGIDQTVAQVGKQYAHQAHHGIEHLHGKHQLIVGVVQCLPVQPAGAV